MVNNGFNTVLISGAVVDHFSIQLIAYIILSRLSSKTPNKSDRVFSSFNFIIVECIFKPMSHKLSELFFQTIVFCLKNKLVSWSVCRSNIAKD